MGSGNGELATNFASDTPEAESSGTDAESSEEEEVLEPESSKDGELVTEPVSDTLEAESNGTDAESSEEEEVLSPESSEESEPESLEDSSETEEDALSSEEEEEPSPDVPRPPLQSHKETSRTASKRSSNPSPSDSLHPISIIYYYLS